MTTTTITSVTIFNTYTHATAHATHMHEDTPYMHENTRAQHQLASLVGALVGALVSHMTVQALLVSGAGASAA